MISFDLERTSAQMGLTPTKASNADIAYAATGPENAAFMRVSLIHLLLLLAFGVRMLGEIANEMILITCLVRPELLTVHGHLQASVLHHFLSRAAAALVTRDEEAIEAASSVT
jgi:hypothetical protein